MPQDSPTVFDGGWRILCGQIPFRDFTMSNAVVPVFLQGLFFKCGRVDWLTYCVHAATFNGLFCVIVFGFLMLMNGNVWTSFFYALLSGVIFYTPFGIPVQDQHAHFFTFLLVVMACLVIRISRVVIINIILFFIPAVSVMAFFSKQIPTVFGVALMCLILLRAKKENLFRMVCMLILGTLFIAVLLLSLFRWLNLDFDLLRVYFWELPAETGGERLRGIFSGHTTVNPYYMLKHWDIFLPFHVTTLFLLTTLAVAIAPFDRFNKMVESHEFSMKIRRNLFLPILAWLMVLICYLFMIMTNNQGANGAPLMMVSLGLLSVFLQTLKSDDGARAQHRVGGHRRAFINIISCLLMITALWSAVKFDRKVNATRMVHDLVFSKQDRLSPKYGQPEALSYLIWKSPARYRGTPEDFHAVVDYFHDHEGNFLLLGDSSVLYALTGRPSVNPVLWFHPGQTLPYRTSPIFPAYEARLMKSMARYQVRYIVLEPTWSSVCLDDFPTLRALVQESGVKRVSYGPFVIIELVNKTDLL